MCTGLARSIETTIRELEQVLEALNRSAASLEAPGLGEYDDIRMLSTPQRDGGDPPAASPQDSRARYSTTPLLRHFKDVGPRGGSGRVQSEEGEEEGEGRLGKRLGACFLAIWVIIE